MPPSATAEYLSLSELAVMADSGPRFRRLEVERDRLIAGLQMMGERYHRKLHVKSTLTLDDSFEDCTMAFCQEVRSMLKRE